MRIQARSTSLAKRPTAAEATDMQHHHILETPDPPEKHQQDTGGWVPAQAKELLDVDMPIPTRSGNCSSVFTPGDRSVDQTALQPHTIRPARDQACEQDPACHVSSASALGDCDQIPGTVDNSSALDDCNQGNSLIIVMVSMSYKPVNTLLAYKLLQRFPASVYENVQVAYTVRSARKSAGAYANNQDDQHGLTKSNLLPPEDLLRGVMYDEIRARGDVRSRLIERYMTPYGSRAGQLDRTGKPGGNRLSDYLEALGAHITSELASEPGGRPINSSRKELLIVVSKGFSESLKNAILQVGSSPLWLRSCFSTIGRHALNDFLL